MLRSNSFKFFTRAGSYSLRGQRSFTPSLSPPSILGPTEPMLERVVKKLPQLPSAKVHTIDPGWYSRISYFGKTLLAQNAFLHSWPLSRIVSINGLTRLGSNIWLKQPHHITGTIKDRVVLHVLLDMIRNQELVNNSNIIAVSSGSYAVSLMVVKYIIEKFTDIKLNVTLIVPNVHRQKEWVKDLIVFSTFSGKAMQTIEASESKGVNKLDLQGRDTLLFTDSDFGKALVQAKEHATKYNFKFIDQQADPRHMDAHATTAKEILWQYPNVTDIVVPAGTGATAMGLEKVLPSHIKVHCHPAETGKISGLGDPSANPGFFNASIFPDYYKKWLRPEDSKPSSTRLGKMIYFPIPDNYDPDDYNGMEYFRSHVGESTLAVLGTAEEIASSPNRQVLVIGSADTGVYRELICNIFILKDYDPQTGIMSVRSHLDEAMGFKSLIRAHYCYDVEDEDQKAARDIYCSPKPNEPFRKDMINQLIIAPMLTFIRRTEGQVPHSRPQTIDALHPLSTRLRL